MRTVITISLNGNAYQLDAVGYDALRTYLGVAEQRLAGNPDQAEILADLEEAIADKCGRYLGPHKNVVSSEEVAEVLREMGPVDGGAGAPAGAAGEGYGAGGGGQQTSAAGSAGVAGAGADNSFGTWADGKAGAAGTGSPGAGGMGAGDRFGTGGAGTGSSTGAGAGSGTGASSAGAGIGAGAAFSTSGSTGSGSAAGEPARHLYQIREGAVISGVCTGLAAYLNIDVAIIRMLFVVLVLLTGGVWILVYLVMMFVIPHAQTSEQHAAAHGWPFNAEELIARAKAHYADFKNNSGRWQRRQWRAQRRMYREQRKEWQEQQRAWEKWGSAHGAPPPPPWATTPPANTSYTTQVLNGLLVPIANLLGALLFIAFFIALMALITRHTLFGWMLPYDIPWWVWIVALIVLYQVIAAPLRRARYAAYYGTPFTYTWIALWGAVVWLGFLTFLAWLAWHKWDQVLDFFQQIGGQWREFMEHGSPGDPVRTTVYFRAWAPFLAWVPPCVSGGYASGRKLEPHGEIDRTDVLGNTTDRDVVDAGLGDRTYVLE